MEDCYHRSQLEIDEWSIKYEQRYPFHQGNIIIDRQLKVFIYLSNTKSVTQFATPTFYQRSRLWRFNLPNTNSVTSFAAIALYRISRYGGINLPNTNNVTHSAKKKVLSEINDLELPHVEVLSEINDLELLRV